MILQSKIHLVIEMSRPYIKTVNFYIHFGLQFCNIFSLMLSKFVKYSFFEQSISFFKKIKKAKGGGGGGDKNRFCNVNALTGTSGTIILITYFKNNKTIYQL